MPPELHSVTNWDDVVEATKDIDELFPDYKYQSNIFRVVAAIKPASSIHPRFGSTATRGRDW